MINRQRFDFALRELGPGQWERFEHLASQFLAGDFDIRTMASPSGDRGRMRNFGIPAIRLNLFSTLWRATGRKR